MFQMEGGGDLSGLEKKSKHFQDHHVDGNHDPKKAFNSKIDKEDLTGNDDKGPMKFKYLSEKNQDPGEQAKQNKNQKDIERLVVTEGKIRTEGPYGGEKIIRDQ